MEFDLQLLRDRQRTQLTGHYLGLHVTAASVALGVGAVAAGSLATDIANGSNGLEPYRLTFVMLWAASLAAVIVAFGGALNGVVVLPARLPAVMDLVQPVLLTVTEFGMFAVLAYRINQGHLPESYSDLGGR